MRTQPFKAVVLSMLAKGLEGFKRWRGGMTPQPIAKTPVPAARAASTCLLFTACPVGIEVVIMASVHEPPLRCLCR